MSLSGLVVRRMTRDEQHRVEVRREIEQQQMEEAARAHKTQLEAQRRAARTAAAQPSALVPDAAKPQTEHEVLRARRKQENITRLEQRLEAVKTGVEIQQAPVPAAPTTIEAASAAAALSDVVFEDGLFFNSEFDTFVPDESFSLLQPQPLLQEANIKLEPGEIDLADVPWILDLEENDEPPLKRC